MCENIYRTRLTEKESKKSQRKVKKVLAKQPKKANCLYFYIHVF